MTYNNLTPTQITKRGFERKKVAGTGEIGRNDKNRTEHRTKRTRKKNVLFLGYGV